MIHLKTKKNDVDDGGIVLKPKRFFPSSLNGMEWTNHQHHQNHHSHSATHSYITIRPKKMDFISSKQQKKERKNLHQSCHVFRWQ